MTVEELYFFHSFLNQKLFDGKLEAVIINIFDYADDRNDELIESEVETELDPFVIWIAEQLLYSDPLYTITVLLHEMIHQYNRQEEIDDIDEEDGSHNEEFRKAAYAHGLTHDGYELKDEVIELVKKKLELYETFKKLTFYY